MSARSVVIHEYGARATQRVLSCIRDAQESLKKMLVEESKEIQAHKILLQYEPYRSMSPQEIGMRIDVPFHHRKAALLRPGIFFTWMRPHSSGHYERPGAFERILSGAEPKFEDWRDDGPLLWLVDVAAVNVSGLQVGRAINDYLLYNGIVQEGERVAFRRHQGRRFGWSTAQRRS